MEQSYMGCLMGEDNIFVLIGRVHHHPAQPTARHLYLWMAEQFDATWRVVCLELITADNQPYDTPHG